ncbi:hypothetical protein RMATCC62417_08442 [Rhizopus microsporus]|nr:hypothetical protein RMATCC62417_08442 [Rhizopus microsporus]
MLKDVETLTTRVIEASEAVPVEYLQNIIHYQFISIATIQKQPNLRYSLIFVCAICNDLHFSIDSLRTHFNTHLNIPSSNSTSPVSSSSDSNPSTSSSSTAGTTFLSPISSTNPLSVTTTAATSYKHSSDNSLESTKIKIIRGSKTIIFDTTLSTKVIPLNTPRIPKADREKLSKHYIFRMQSIEDMSAEDAAVVRTHQVSQQSISSMIDHHSNILDILKHALSSCKAHVELFEYAYPNLDPASTTQDNQNFYRMVKHILLDFSSKCFRTTPIYSNHERTFFADRVIPIFSAFENHHQNIHFEWCEKTIKSLQTVLFLAIDIQRATSSFADGLGYSTLVGHMDDERVVFEASSGGANEDQSHTQDDALKLIRILTSILVLKAYDLKNARFETFVKYMAISIQVIKRKITLSVLSMDKDKKFVFEERRSATIPISYQERYNWIQVFELLADFEQLLKEQDEIEGLLREENAGRAMVGEETVRSIFEAKQYGIDRSQASINDSSSTYIPPDDEQY